MKIKILLGLLFFTAYGFAQKSSDSIKRLTYMDIKKYQEKVNRPLTKEDSLKFKTIHGETFILTEGTQRQRKGATVKYEYKDATFLEQYKKVAFMHKNDSINKQSSMKYWKEDIRIFFSESVSKKVKKEVLSFAKEIDSKIDSLKITQVKKVEDSNYIIYYFGDYEYENRMNKYKNNSYYLFWNGKNQIYSAAVKIDANKSFSDKLRVYEIKKLIFQSLGHFNFDNDLVCDDYFSGCYSDNKKLSTLDLELLKYHYSYGICKGTDLETFEEQHKRAKEILKEHNTLIRFFHEEE